MTRAIAAITLAAAFVAPQLLCAQGVMRKCVDSAGKVTYQDSPCAPVERTVATIQRDTREADPVATKRAKAEREEAAKVRTARLIAEEKERSDARVEQDRAESRARLARAEARAEASHKALMESLNQPTYIGPGTGYSGSSPIVIRERAPTPAPARINTPTPAAVARSGPAKK